MFDNLTRAELLELGEMLYRGGKKAGKLVQAINAMHMMSIDRHPEAFGEIVRTSDIHAFASGVQDDCFRMMGMAYDRMTALRAAEDQGAKVAAA